MHLALHWDSLRPNQCWPDADPAKVVSMPPTELHICFLLPKSPHVTLVWPAVVVGVLVTALGVVVVVVVDVDVVVVVVGQETLTYVSRFMYPSLAEWSVDVEALLVTHVPAAKTVLDPALLLVA